MSYIGAPYNFIRFPGKTFAPVSADELKTHDRIDDTLLTGEISYSITAETPIFIDDGNGEFFKNEYGEYAIPGSTIRGLLRNNVQIMSSSCFDADVDDYYLMYRHVAEGALKKTYNDILGNKPVPYGKRTLSVLKNVKAGMIKNENGKYYIYPTKTQSVDTNMPNYYILSERTIADSYLKNPDKFPYDFFVENGHSIMQHEIDKSFKKSTVNGRIHYKGVVNKSYKPYYKECSYESSGKNVIAVSKPGKRVQKGFVISSGYMNEKKAIYIIPAIDYSDDKRIEIPPSDVRAYKIDYRRKEKTLKANKKFFALPEKNEQKPVFYIPLKERLYFGFTPRLRLFFDHRIKEGYKQETAPDKTFDMSQSIFGLSDNSKGSFKSKVSMSDAIADDKSNVTTTKKVVLAEPKPTSYLDYIIQSDKNNPVTYNSDLFELRGIKQYWIHGSIDIGNQNTKNDNIGSSIKPLDVGTVFKGSIRFNNLTEKELGLLLWALKLEPNSHMNIGKGKPYGYGHIAVSDIRAKIIDNNTAYDLNALSLNPYVAINIDDYINDYKQIDIYGVKPSELPAVKELLSMKNSKNMPDPSKIKYMSIDNGDYKNRKTPLLSIDEILDNSNEEDVIVISVQPDNKDSKKCVAKIDGGMVFNVPPTIHVGDHITITITSEKNGRIFGNYKSKP